MLSSLYVTKRWTHWRRFVSKSQQHQFQSRRWQIKYLHPQICRVNIIDLILRAIRQIWTGLYENKNRSSWYPWIRKFINLWKTVTKAHNQCINNWTTVFATLIMINMQNTFITNIVKSGWLVQKICIGRQTCSFDSLKYNFTTRTIHVRRMSDKWTLKERWVIYACWVLSITRENNVHWVKWDDTADKFTNSDDDEPKTIYSD